jgi:hypothetical protein
MAKLEQIARERPSFLTGNRAVVSNDPELISLAEKHNNERMRHVSSAVTDEISLTGDETTVLLEWVGNHAWRNNFERNLQSLSAKVDGDLLTTWMPLAEFETLIIGDQHEGPVVLRELFRRIVKATEHWRGLGVDEVYFDGYELKA